MENDASHNVSLRHFLHLPHDDRPLGQGGIRTIEVADNHVWCSENNGDVVIRNLQGEVVHTIPFNCIQHIQGMVWSMRSTSDQTFVWVGGSDGPITVWNTGGMFTRADTLIKHTGGVMVLATHPTRKLMYSGGVDMKVYEWSTTANKVLRVFHRSDVGGVRCIQPFHAPNLGNNSPAILLCVGGDDGLLRCWTLEGSFGKAGHHNSVEYVSRKGDSHSGVMHCMAKCNNRIWTGGDDKCIRVWEIVEGKNDQGSHGKVELVKVLHGHEGRVCSLLQMGNRVWSGATDCTILIWDSLNLSLKQKINAHKGCVTNLIQVQRNITVTSDVWTGASDRTLALWCITDDNVNSSSSFLWDGGVSLLSLSNGFAGISTKQCSRHPSPRASSPTQYKTPTATLSPMTPNVSAMSEISQSVAGIEQLRLELVQKENHRMEEETRASAFLLKGDTLNSIPSFSVAHDSGDIIRITGTEPLSTRSIRSRAYDDRDAVVLPLPPHSQSKGGSQNSDKLTAVVMHNLTLQQQLSSLQEAIANIAGDSTAQITTASQAWNKVKAYEVLAMALEAKERQSSGECSKDAPSVLNLAREMENELKSLVKTKNSTTFESFDHNTVSTLAHQLHLTAGQVENSKALLAVAEQKSVQQTLEIQRLNSLLSEHVREISRLQYNISINPSPPIISDATHLEVCTIRKSLLEEYEVISRVLKHFGTSPQPAGQTMSIVGPITKSMEKLCTLEDKLASLSQQVKDKSAQDLNEDISKEIAHCNQMVKALSQQLEERETQLAEKESELQKVNQAFELTKHELSATVMGYQAICSKNADLEAESHRISQLYCELEVENTALKDKVEESLKSGAHSPISLYVETVGASSPRTGRGLERGITTRSRSIADPTATCSSSVSVPNFIPPTLTFKKPNPSRDVPFSMSMSRQTSDVNSTPSPSPGDMFNGSPAAGEVSGFVPPPHLPTLRRNSSGGGKSRKSGFGGGSPTRNAVGKYSSRKQYSPTRYRSNPPPSVEREVIVGRLGGWVTHPALKSGTMYDMQPDNETESVLFQGKSSPVGRRKHHVGDDIVRMKTPTME